MSLVRRVARPMLSAMFVVGGIDALRHPGAKAPAVAGSPISMPRSEKLGLTDDESLVRANGAAMTVGGLAFAAGKFPRLSAAVLAGTLVPTTFAAHRFWEEKDAEAAKGQRIQFLKNVGLLGGCLLAVVDTDGRESLPRRTRRAAKQTAKATSRSAGRAKHKLP